MCLLFIEYSTASCEHVFSVTCYEHNIRLSVCLSVTLMVRDHLQQQKEELGT